MGNKIIKGKNVSTKNLKQNKQNESFKVQRYAQNKFNPNIPMENKSNTNNGY